MKSFKFNNEELFLDIGTYNVGKGLAILCGTVDEPFTDVTINLPGMYLSSIDKAYIDPMCEYCGLYQTLIDLGIIKEVVKEKVSYNMGKYDLVRFDMDKLKEYDPEGLEEYLKENGYDKDISLNPSI